MTSENHELIMKRYSDEAIIRAAEEIMSRRVNKGTLFNSPQVVKDYLRFKQGASENEQFTVVFLDSQNRSISTETMFQGSVSQASVYPREIVKRGLRLNASAIILCHNHPSGSLVASDADVKLTRVIRGACEMVDIRVLDHIIVSVEGSVSLAEKGLI